MIGCCQIHFVEIVLHQPICFLNILGMCLSSFSILMYLESYSAMIQHCRLYTSQSYLSYILEGELFHLGKNSIFYLCFVVFLESVVLTRNGSQAHNPFHIVPCFIISERTSSAGKSKLKLFSIFSISKLMFVFCLFDTRRTVHIGRT